MEIPGNFKNKAIQDRIKVSSKKSNPKVDTGPGSTAKPVQGTENIALSSKARDIQKAHETVRSAPDIRVDKVDRIKKEIAEGRFHVDSHDLAEKILKDMITESKFLG